RSAAFMPQKRAIVQRAERRQPHRHWTSFSRHKTCRQLFCVEHRSSVVSLRLASSEFVTIRAIRLSNGFAPQKSRAALRLPPQSKSRQARPRSVEPRQVISVGLGPRKRHLGCVGEENRLPVHQITGNQDSIIRAVLSCRHEAKLVPNTSRGNDGWG